MVKIESKSQHDKFKEAAKELDCDEDEARFDDTVKKLAKVGYKRDNEKKN